MSTSVIKGIDPVTGEETLLKVSDTGMLLDVLKDAITKALMTTDSDHSATHLGYGFKAHLEAANLAAGASVSWCWTGPSTKFAHVKNIALSVLGSSAKLEILVGASVTVDTGALVPLVNTNNNPVAVAQSTIKANPTYSGGTVWDMTQVFIDSTAQNVGSAVFNSGATEEIVSKSASTKYILKLTNTGADPLQKAWIKMFMYEEPIGII